MSRAEEITSEVRKLVLTCRSLEAQLQQSVPKKTYQETVATMQANIDSLNAELSRTKSDLENTTSLGQRISSLESHISTQNEAVCQQGKVIESLSARLAENTIPMSIHTQAVSKVQELESRISSMVDVTEYSSLQKRCAELEAQIATSVPKTQYAALEIELANSVPIQKYEELQRSFAQRVPREQLQVAEARVAELERALTESVPRQDFEELTSRIAQITREAAELASRVAAPVFYSEPEVVAEQHPVTQVAPAATVSDQPPTSPEPMPSISVEATETQEIVPQTAPVIEEITSNPQPSTVEPQQTPSGENATPTLEVPQDPMPSAAPQPEAATPVVVAEAENHEIAEVQSQLSEINTAIETGASTIPSPQQPLGVVDPERGFKFSNTEFCARTGMEFLQDLERVDISIIASHSHSGDFERWFKEVLADESAAESLRAIRESNVTGEELRTMVVAAISPRYRS